MIDVLMNCVEEIYDGKKVIQRRQAWLIELSKLFEGNLVKECQVCGESLERKGSERESTQNFILQWLHIKRTQMP